MDKLAHIAWLGGGMIAGAYYIYSGARIFCCGFKLRDIRPAAAGGTVLLMLMIMLGAKSENSEIFARITEFVNSWGFLLLGAPLIASGMAAPRSKCLKCG